VSEVYSRGFSSQLAARIFGDISGAIKFIVGTYKSQKLLVNRIEFSEARVRASLKGKLSTISISNEIDEHRKCLLTTF